jgi:hypothetical protein
MSQQCRIVVHMTQTSTAAKVVAVVALAATLTGCAGSRLATRPATHSGAVQPSTVAKHLPRLAPTHTPASHHHAVHVHSDAPREHVVIPTHTAAPVQHAAPVAPAGYGCAAAIAYLHANANPAFTIECPGNAVNPQGGPAQAMTCSNDPMACPGRQVIAIRDACPTAYKNEAANSWILVGLRPGSIDPYGSSC